MVTIGYKSLFLRQYAKLPPALQREVKDKVEVFQKNPQTPSLYVHKLKGRLKGCLSFSVNYQYRVVFFYESKNRAVLVDVGDHSIYE